MPPNPSLRIPDWPTQDPSICDAINQCFHSGDWGKYDSQTCRDFTDAISEMHGRVNTRIVSSGSAAIELALRSARVGFDDQVVVATYDFPGNFRTIEAVGATPVLVDVDLESLSIDVAALSQLDPAKIKAVIASHLHGHQADLGRMKQICKQHGWLLIEDACQAIGQQTQEQTENDESDDDTADVMRADALALSFGGSKLVSAGCGGAILTSDPAMTARLNSLADRPGQVYPMSALQAAAAMAQLGQLQAWNVRRSECVDFILENVARQTSRWQWLAGNSNVRSLNRCEQSSGDEGPQKSKHVPAYYKLGILTENQKQRDNLIAAAVRYGLPIGEGFRSMHRSSRRRCRRPNDLPVSQRLGECLAVLDHRALMIHRESYELLAEALVGVYQDSIS